MANLECECPHCGQELDIGDELLGTTVNCPACKGAIKVPGVKQETPVAPPQAPPQTGGQKFNCPQCTHPFNATPGANGRVNCPLCNRPLWVLTQMQAPASATGQQPSLQQHPETPTPPEQKTSRWREQEVKPTNHEDTKPQTQPPASATGQQPTTRRLRNSPQTHTTITTETSIQPLQNRSSGVGIRRALVIGLSCLALFIAIGAVWWSMSSPKIIVKMTQPDEIAKCITIKDVEFKNGVFSCTYRDTFQLSKTERENNYYYSHIKVTTYNGNGVIVDRQSEFDTAAGIKNETGESLLTVKTDTRGQQIRRVEVESTSSESSRWSR